MDYTQADKIRNKSLLQLIAEKKFKQEQSLGSSITGAFSDKMKAKATGIKEKLDPLNMIKALTGEGVLGKSLVTVVGRASGRSEENIRRFGGYGSRKRKLKERSDPNFTTIGSDETGEVEPGDSVADVLAKLTSFMEKKHELEKKDREIDEAFRQEQIDEDDRRHKELVTAIREFTGGRKTYTVETKEEGLGFFDGIKKWVMDTFGDLLILKSLKDLAGLASNLLKGLAVFLTGGGLAFLALLAGIYGAKKLLEYINDKTPDMSVLSPTEAANALKNGSEKDISAQGGKEKLQEIVKKGPTAAKEILDRNDEKEILAAGGKDKLLQIIKEGEVPVPTESEMTGTKLPEKIHARPDTTGGKNAGRAKEWDNKWSKNYNPDGTKKQSVPQETKPANTATPVPQETKPAPTAAPAIPNVKRSESSGTSSPQTVPVETKNVYNNIVTAPKVEAVAEVPVKNIPALIDEGDISNQNSSVVAVNNNVQNLGSNKQDIVNTASTSVRGPIRHRVVPV
jgi:hypothetical protein